MSVGDRVERAMDWRTELLDVLGERNAYAFDYLEAVALDVAGDGLEALRVAGEVLEHLSGAVMRLWALQEELHRRSRGLRPYRNLALPDRRVVDLAPVRLAKDEEVRAAMESHYRLLPDLEGIAVMELCAAAKAPPN